METVFESVYRAVLKGRGHPAWLAAAAGVFTTALAMLLGPASIHAAAAACPPDYYLNSSGVCVDRCSPGRSRNAKGQCVPDACPTGMARDASGVCIPHSNCPPGWVPTSSWLGVTCAPRLIPVCAANRHWDGTQCVLNPCPPGNVRLASGACVPSTGVGCPPGTVRSANGGCGPSAAIVCAPGMVVGPGNSCIWPGRR